MSSFEDLRIVDNESFQVMECTWMRHLDNAQDDAPGELDGYPPPYHDFNGITSEFGVHFILHTFPTSPP